MNVLIFCAGAVLGLGVGLAAGMVYNFLVVRDVYRMVRDYGDILSN